MTLDKVQWRPVVVKGMSIRSREMGECYWTLWTIISAWRRNSPFYEDTVISFLLGTAVKNYKTN